MRTDLIRAIIITEENYFMAAACLPPRFREFPPEVVYGFVLIVNEPLFSGRLIGHTPELFNSWLRLLDFNQDYSAVISGEEINDQKFIRVALTYPTKKE